MKCSHYQHLNKDKKVEENNEVHEFDEPTKLVFYHDIIFLSSLTYMCAP
jgi:hypothetical protein